MRKPTKQELKVIAQIAATLPATKYEAKQKTIMMGFELKKRPELIELIQGPIKDDQAYSVDANILLPVNHKKRIKRAFETGGMDAVNDYCKSVVDLSKGELSGQNTNVPLYNWI